MRAINITNEKARNAEVGFEVKRRKSDITMTCPDGQAYANVRLLKSTTATDIQQLLAQHGDNASLAEAIINDNPEVDMEMVGMQLHDVRKVYLNEGGKVVYRIKRLEAVFSPTGELREMRAVSDAEANVNTDIPLRWTGKIIPIDKAIRTFVFARKYQVKHVNGLTYDFLYDMARQLSERRAMMLVGSGPKGTGPVVLSKGGTAYRAFLSGEVDGSNYRLVLHLTNLELKSLQNSATTINA